MKEQWLVNPLAGYEENARHLFSYPDSTMHEYGLDLRKFIGWLKERQVQGAEDGKTERLGFHNLLSCSKLLTKQNLAFNLLAAFCRHWHIFPQFSHTNSHTTDYSMQAGARRIWSHSGCQRVRRWMGEKSDGGLPSRA